MNLQKTFKESPELFQEVTARFLAVILAPIFKYNRHRWLTHNPLNPEEMEIPSRKRILRSIQYMIKNETYTGGIDFSYPSWRLPEEESSKIFVRYRDEKNKQNLLFILIPSNKHARYRLNQKRKGLCVSCTRKRINATYCKFHAAKRSATALIKSGRTVKMYDSKFGSKGDIIGEAFGLVNLNYQSESVNLLDKLKLCLHYFSTINDKAMFYNLVSNEIDRQIEEMEQSIFLKKKYITR